MRWWSGADARAWRQAASAVLQTDPGLVEWEREKALVDAQLRVEWEGVDVERRVAWESVRTPATPPGLIERWGWFNGPHLDHWGRALELCGDTWVLLAILCEDLLASDRASETPSAAQLLDLIVSRPSLLALLATRIQQHPALLADVLLQPSTSAWGCLMAADWNAHPIGAWERPLQEAEGTESRERAFADAMAIAALHLRSGKGSVAEMADLLVWLHGRVLGDAHAMPGRQRKVTDRMLRAEYESDRVAAYSAVALARMGRKDEANAALAASEAAHPNSGVLKAAREHLNLGTPGHFGVLTISTDDPVAAIQSALYRLAQLDPGMQARVVSRETMEVHLTEEIRSAAAGVTSLVPNLREVTLQEDDVTAVLLRILEPRARLFGWSVPDQSKGGYSPRGNPGERDLVLRKDGYVISVIEAMICNQNPKTETQRKNLTSHFQKLFGCDQCRVFFHVVYSYVETPEDVLAEMKDVVRSSAPPA